MADVSVEGNTITLDLPIQVPEFTLTVRESSVTSVIVDGTPLTEAGSRSAFENNTFYRKGDTTLVAFTPASRAVSLTIG